jgi:hypothetical protein
MWRLIRLANKEGDAIHIDTDLSSLRPRKGPEDEQCGQVSSVETLTSCAGLSSRFSNIEPSGRKPRSCGDSVAGLETTNPAGVESGVEGELGELGTDRDMVAFEIWLGESNLQTSPQSTDASCTAGKDKIEQSAVCWVTLLLQELRQILLEECE